MKKQSILWSVMILAMLLTLAAGVGPDRAGTIRHRRPAAGFNGDGRADLVVGVYNEDLGAAPDAGAVDVLHGASPNGLTAAGNQFWSQDSAGITSATAETGDRFGQALAIGDFDRDGYLDLAIGVPGEDLTGNADAGVVHVLYGSWDSLTGNGDQLWSQDSPGITDTAEAGDQFGRALAVADFNGDGFDDLAIGVPYEDLGGLFDVGAVNILYGSSDGLSSTDSQFWNQGSVGVVGDTEPWDSFGYSLAAGDFDGDGFDDLAVGVPYEAVGAVSSAGSVNILYGSHDGLSATGDQLWHQDSTGIGDVVEDSDQFGQILAVGDFNGDGFDDLAVGVPYEDLSGLSNPGAVNVLYGSATGLSATGNQFWNQGVAGIVGAIEAEDQFGAALTAGDFDGDGFDDLAIGVPYEDTGVGNEGVVHVLYGSAARLSATGSQLWDQDSPGILGTAGSGDYFGYALAAGDFNRDGFDDLAVGVPFEDTAGVQNAGGVNVLYGSAAKLSSTGNQFWSQASPGINVTAEVDDHFGNVLAAARARSLALYLPNLVH